MIADFIFGFLFIAVALKVIVMVGDEIYKKTKGDK